MGAFSPHNKKSIILNPYTYIINMNKEKKRNLLTFQITSLFRKGENYETGKYQKSRGC